MANEIRLRANNISGTITDNPLLIGATTINSPGFVDLPTVNTTNHLILILDPLELSGAAEIVQVTAHAAASSTVTVVRGAETTTPRQHGLGTTWFHGPVVSDWVESVTSATRPTIPYRGDLIYEIDTDKFVGRAGNDTWEDVVPMGQWTDYTPVWVQGAATITYTLNYARFHRSGRKITVNVFLTATGAGSAGTTISVTVPVAIASASVPRELGTHTLFDTSLAQGFSSNVICDTGNNGRVQFRGGYSANEAVQVLGNAGSGFALAIAAGDQIGFNATYEAAS